MKHAAVLELRMSHPFYRDGRCPDLAIEPGAATARLLDRHGCFLRWSPGGVRVVTPLDATGQPLRPFPAGASLFFDLRLTNPDFALFTDLSDLQGTRSPLYTNVHLAAAATGELPLTSRTLPDPDTGEPIPVRQAPGVLAEVEIFLHPGGSGGRALPIAIFQVSFRPRRWRWAYYCVTDLAAEGGELTIVDASPPGTAGALHFSETNRTDLGEHPDPSDPIAAQLAARRPGMRRVRFLSDEAVACREEPRKLLELRLDGERVSSPLSNPSVRRFFRREPALPDPEPQDLLFQIIEYRSQPFPHP